MKVRAGHRFGIFALSGFVLLTTSMVGMTLLLAFLLPFTTTATILADFDNSTEQLLNYITIDRKGKAFDWLAEICDDFGHRKTGSQALEDAIDFVVAGLKADGFDVHTEPVPGLPNWHRGDDRVWIMEPRLHRMNILAIDGCPTAQVQAEVVVLHRHEELETVDVRNKIVLFAEKWMGYGRTVAYRSRSAKLAAAKGAVGVLVKSVTPFSISSPHTGTGARNSTIPAACVTLEEAEMIERWLKRGKTVTIKMDMSSYELEPVISRNVVFDIKGSEKPNEIVLLSGHIDSWDVGQGAMDDGGGIASVREAMYSILQLSKNNPEFRPKRTIRGVFWTAEEQGMYGSTAYFKEHFNKTENFIFASETDMGAFRPLNLHSIIGVSAKENEFKKISQIVEKINYYGFPFSVAVDSDQGDVQLFADNGVASINYRPDRTSDTYFYFHHTQGDYMTIFKEGDLEATSAVFAAFAHNIANMNSWDN